MDSSKILSFSLMLIATRNAAYFTCHFSFPRADLHRCRRTKHPPDVRCDGGVEPFNKDVPWLRLGLRSSGSLNFGWPQRCCTDDHPRKLMLFLLSFHLGPFSSYILHMTFCKGWNRPFDVWRVDIDVLATWLGDRWREPASNFPEHL